MGSFFLSKTIGNQYDKAQFYVNLYFRQDRLHRIDGDSKADAGIAATFAEDKGVDADHFAVDIGEWAAAIAGVDGRIRLDHIAIDASVLAGRKAAIHG